MLRPVEARQENAGGVANLVGDHGALGSFELEGRQDQLLRRFEQFFGEWDRLAKFEGDAAFFCALADKVDGSLLQDSIEQAYFAFRRRLRNIKQANSCECQARSRMQSLDVKFVVHQGEFIRHKMSGREELAGRDVILVHRLLKNDVGKTFGAHAYALYSDACVRAVGIDPQAQGLVEHSEAIEHIGDTKCWVCDLEQAWSSENEARRRVVERANAIGVIETDFPAPRPVVWDLITMPGNRPRWQGSDSVVENTVKGRRGAGTQNHCLHGKDAIIEDILDWLPFDHITFTTLLPTPDAPKILMTYAFDEREDGGTHFEVHFAKPKPKDLPFYEHIWPNVQSKFAGEFEILRALLAEQAIGPIWPIRHEADGQSRRQAVIPDRDGDVEVGESGHSR